MWADANETNASEAMTVRNVIILGDVCRVVNSSLDRLLGRNGFGRFEPSFCRLEGSGCRTKSTRRKIAALEDRTCCMVLQRAAGAVCWLGGGVRGLGKGE